MINKLVKFANHLDSKGLLREADYLDKIIRKIAINPDEQTYQGHFDDEIYIINDDENERARRNRADTEHSLAQMLSDFFDKDESGAIDFNEVSDMLDLFKNMISAYAKKHNQSEEEAREFMVQELTDHMGSRVDLSGYGRNLY